MQEAVGGVFEVVDEILGLDEIKLLLGGVQEQHPMLLEEVFAKDRLSYPEFSELVRRLVREHVNVRDLKLILEGVAEFCSSNAENEDRQEWLARLHAYLRVVLSRSIIADSLGPGDRLRLFVLAPRIEDEFRTALAEWEHVRMPLALDPAFEMSLRARARKVFNPVMERGALPVVVACSSDVRAAVQEFFRRQMAPADCIRTIAYQELSYRYEPESIGVIGLEN